MMALATFLTGTMQNTLVHMTFLAIQLQMHTIQQEVLVVLGSILPAALVVTLGTKRTIRALMHILVTSLTIPLRQFREEILALEILRWCAESFVRILVTFCTLHLTVLALQLEICFLMIEFLQLGELLCRVADSARFAMELRMKHVLVFIYMTLFAEPAVRPFEHEFRAFARRLGRDRKVAGLMAFAALLANFFVPAGEFKTCLIVIKLRQFGKTTGSVTACTGFFLHFAAELLLVHGLMAVGTVLFVFVLVKVKLMSRFGRLGW